MVVTAERSLSFMIPTGENMENGTVWGFEDLDELEGIDFSRTTVAEGAFLLLRNSAWARRSSSIEKEIEKELYFFFVKFYIHSSR